MGSADPQRQAEVILEESAERTLEPEGHQGRLVPGALRPAPATWLTAGTTSGPRRDGQPTGPELVPNPLDQLPRGGRGGLQRIGLTWLVPLVAAELVGDSRPAGQALPITSTQSKHLWQALGWVYERLGFEAATDGDEVFRQLVLARLVEPTSKLDTIRVLIELGIQAAGYRTIFRRLPTYATAQWRQGLEAACADHVGLGPATLVLYDVTTLYFETDKADGFREPGFSKERRLEPQITVGLLSDVRGFPLQVQ